MAIGEMAKWRNGVSADMPLANGEIANWRNGKLAKGRSGVSADSLPVNGMDIPNETEIPGSPLGCLGSHGNGHKIGE